MNINATATHATECTCLSWKPIIAGALVAIGLSFLLNLFSVAIGLTVFTTNSEGVQILVFSGLIACCIGIVTSMFASGWITGYLGQRHCNKRHLGALYGFLAWCVALIVTIFIATQVQQYVSFYGNFLSGSNAAIQVSHSAAPLDNVVTTASMPANNLVISTYILFSLFFLSAFACSLGGHCGMRYVCKHSGTC